MNHVQDLFSTDELSLEVLEALVAIPKIAKLVKEEIDYIKEECPDATRVDVLRSACLNALAIETVDGVLFCTDADGMHFKYAFRAGVWCKEKQS